MLNTLKEKQPKISSPMEKHTKSQFWLRNLFISTKVVSTCIIGFIMSWTRVNAQSNVWPWLNTLITNGMTLGQTESIVVTGVTVIGAFEEAQAPPLTPADNIRITIQHPDGTFYILTASSMDTRFVIPGTIITIEAISTGGSPTCANIYPSDAVTSGGIVGEICVSAPLPITLLSLQAQPQKTKTHLTWRTASESNNDRFEVEHSRNGVSFEALGQVPGHGTTTEPNEYSFTHERPGPGTHYYRLRQVDFDGRYSYSQVVSIDFPSLEDLESLALWPNPTTGIVNLGGEVPERAIYTISDALGQALIQGEIMGNQIDLGNLKSGLYQISINDEKNVATYRLLKQ